jgi:hypothetical protein
MNDQETAMDSIQTGIAQTGVWRRGLNDRYPHDTRNLPAADKLDELAQADSREVREAVWDTIAPFIKSKVFDEVLSEVSREVGFRQRPKDFNAFLDRRR